MNIFYLSPDPHEAARFHCDKHVVKMVLETAQILSTVHHICDGVQRGYKPTHINHPSVQWAAKSINNYAWLQRLFNALSCEYARRYHKVHKSWTMLGLVLAVPPNNISNLPFTDPPKCVPDDCKLASTVASYRLYYRKYKYPILKYTGRTAPSWL